jgi:hypothetical protein
MDTFGPKLKITCRSLHGMALDTIIAVQLLNKLAKHLVMNRLLPKKFTVNENKPYKIA